MLGESQPCTHKQESEKATPKSPALSGLGPHLWTMAAVILTQHLSSMPSGWRCQDWVYLVLKG